MQLKYNEKSNGNEMGMYIIGIGTIMLLSVLLGICALVLTVMPCDLHLIKILVVDIRILLMNVWPIFCVMYIVYALLNNAWISFLCTGILVFVIAEVNRFKMAFRDDPFVFSDVLLIGEAKDMVRKYKLFLDKVSLCAIIFIVLTTVLCALILKNKLKSKAFRISSALLVCVLFCVSSQFLYFKDQKIYNATWHSEFGNQWKTGNQYTSRGVVYSFVKSITDAGIPKPDDYSKRAVSRLLKNYEDTNMEEEKKVHIISIMLEAYNDFSEFEQIEFRVDPYDNFHNIQKKSYHGKLFTDIFAAGTIKTERSFLTGFSNIEIKNKDTESYVRYLKEQGYYVEAMHPSYGWFYNRKNINNYLGFENFEYHENRYCNAIPSELSEALYHNLLADNDFFNYIIEGYERNVENGKKYFNFSITYQNHGPYPEERETDIEYIYKEEGYTENEYNIFNNYLHGIAKTDRALGKLVDYIDVQQEPIVMILFGDHNPSLGENNSVYEMLGINLDLDTAEGAKNYYETPYVFYANQAAKEQLQRDFNEQGDTISPMFLMSEYFEYIGSGGSAYLNYLGTIKEEFSVINPVYVKKGENYFLRTKFDNDDILCEQQQVEYYVKSKKIDY